MRWQICGDPSGQGEHIASEVQYAYSVSQATHVPLEQMLAACPRAPGQSAGPWQVFGGATQDRVVRSHTLSGWLLELTGQS
jgi:hypothetical protein